MESALHDIFIQEAEENIHILEERIIKIEQDPQDSELINDAFRAIHSIKGGAGFAGFPKMKDFSHILEDLFEEIRSERLFPEAKIISVILESLDVLKLFVKTIQDSGNEEFEMDTGPMVTQIKDILKKGGMEKKTEDGVGFEPDLKKDLYFIKLKFYPEIFSTGINPLMFILDLETSGKMLAIELHTDDIPELSNFDPELFYLSWSIFLETMLSPQNVEDIFCFVQDDSEIEIINIVEASKVPDDLDKYKVNGKNIFGYVNPEEYNLSDRRKSKTRRTEDTASGDGGISSFIRVQTDKLENIFNTVGELLITQARLNMFSEDHGEIMPEGFSHVADSLNNISKVLQEQVASLRMMSLSSTFDRFTRVVRDIANDLGKKVQLETEGKETELDKNMIEKLNDPLKHIVRNSIDHGIETEEERIALGKDPSGHVKLSAYIENGKVILKISDDGRGIDKKALLEKAIERGLIRADQQLSDSEILNLIFNPGLSTAKKVTDLSGRGVGMDVVRSAINELHGTVEISSEEGKGTTITIYLPLTLAILDGMLVNVGEEKYIIPTLSVLEIFKPDGSQLKTISGKGEIAYFRGEYIPLIRLHRVFEIPDAISETTEGEVLVVSSGGMKAALLVDKVLEQYQIVLKSLQQNFRKVENISSATILGDGDVALIIDIQNIIQYRL